MESTGRRALAAIFVLTAVAIGTTNGALVDKEANDRYYYTSLGEYQMDRLRNVLARLRAEKDKTDETQQVQRQNPSGGTQHHQQEEGSRQQGTAPEQKQQQHQEAGQKKFNEHHHNYIRQPALSAEDMPGQQTDTLHGDHSDIVAQLRRLDTVHKEQILARTLEKMESELRTLEDQDSPNSIGDDMGTSANVDTSSTGGDEMDRSQLIESLITQALVKLGAENEDSPKQVLHQDKTDANRGNERATEPLNKPAERLNEENKEGVEVEGEYLRQQVLRLMEDRLLQDISMANLMNVSVADLIRDLEQKDGAVENEETKSLEEGKGSEVQNQKDDLTAKLQWIDNLLAKHEQGED